LPATRQRALCPHPPCSSQGQALDPRFLSGFSGRSGQRSYSSSASTRMSRNARGTKAMWGTCNRYRAGEPSARGARASVGCGCHSYRSAPVYSPPPARTAVASPATDGQTVLVPEMVNNPYHPHWTAGGRYNDPWTAAQHRSAQVGAAIRLAARGPGYWQYVPGFAVRYHMTISRRHSRKTALPRRVGHRAL
jgi:hypothetical protein